MKQYTVTFFNRSGLLSSVTRWARMPEIAAAMVARELHVVIFSVS